MAKWPPVPWESVSKQKGKQKQRAGMLVDLRRCTGCHACSVACKTEHQVPLGQFRTRVRYLQEETKQTISFLPLLCMQCADAPCLKACDAKALTKRADGVITVEQDKCDGNGACVSACPYGAIYVDPVTNKADKCDMCVERTDLGLEPACVDVCPTGALLYGDWGAPKDPMVSAAAKHKTSVSQAGKQTKPQVRYIGLSPWMDERGKSVQLTSDEDEVIYEQGKQK